MPPPAKKSAKWSVDARNATFDTDADGSLHAVLPLMDAGTKIADIKVDITADRIFTLTFVATTGLTPDKAIVDFQAWSNV